MCRRDIAAIPRVVGCRRISDVQGFLNGRKRDFCRVFDLLGMISHVQSDPSLYFLRIPKPPARECPSRSFEPMSCPALVANAKGKSLAVHHFPKTSY
jgi:hypothetical protein